jgi:hypothetical protein
VQAAAGAVEKAIREGREGARLEPLLAKLGDALGSLSAGLGPWLGEPSTPEAAALEDGPPPDPATLKALVERWCRLLAECDAGTSDGLAQEGPALRALFGPGPAFARFKEQVASYEFEKALAALRHAAHEKGL